MGLGGSASFPAIYPRRRTGHAPSLQLEVVFYQRTMFIIKDSLSSTNSYLAGIAADAPHGTVVMAREQTAGRGQRGNSWEAEPGQNITLSLLLRPEGLHPARQFVISQAVSLAIVDMLQSFVTEPVSIKWPNDIYVGDRKICGILIEHTITCASIDRTVVGIGLNVNQMEFHSDAPNPVSLRQLMPKVEFDPESLAREMVRDILERVDAAITASASPQALTQEYFRRLWRNEGWHPYHDNLRDVDMTARIDGVDPSGIITLTDRADGVGRQYAFKEITALLPYS